MGTTGDLCQPRTVVPKLSGSFETGLGTALNLYEGKGKVEAAQLL